MYNTEISFHFSSGTIWPHCGPDKAYLAKETPLASLWRKYPKAIRLLYYTDWDCGEELPYWFVIKDSPFEINELKAKRRYEITKANKNFIVRQINIDEEGDAMYDVYKEAILGYSTARPPQYSLEEFKKTILPWGDNDAIVYGAFSMDSEMCGYAFLTMHSDHASFVTLKTKPSSEKLGINAAICNKILLDLEEELKKPGFYISDGSRNIYHQTHFQNYLEKYFQFRKAYCRLQVEYRPVVKPIIKCIYPLRRLFEKLDNIKYVHMLNAILKSEEIARHCN